VRWNIKITTLRGEGWGGLNRNKKNWKGWVLLRCQEIDGWDSKACFFVFILEGEDLHDPCLQGFCNKNMQIPWSCLLCSVLFCTLSLFHSLSVHISLYDDHFRIVNECDSLCCYSTVTPTHHPLLAVRFVSITIGICFVYSKSDKKFRVCSLFFIFHDK